MTDFPRLFEPFTGSRLKSRNRIVMLPHGTHMVAAGTVTDEDIAYYEARARSGVGLVITGATVIHPTTAGRGGRSIQGYNDQALASLQRRSEAIQRQGAAHVTQLLHLGRETIGGEFQEVASAPSAIRSPRDPFPPHALEPDEIRTLVEAYGHTARNMQAIGCDGVEIHGAHGYLVAQFLSPATNYRDDAYGGDAERRMRFLLEVIEEIRLQCGDGFALGLRLSADEELADGVGVADTAQICKRLGALNALDYLSITIGVRGGYVKDVSWPKAPAARAAKIVREIAGGLPVIVGQRITNPQIAERLLEEGAADFVGMTRALIADDDWAGKAARGEAARIRPCIAVLQDCRAGQPHLHCAVNPLTGRERQPGFVNTERAAVARKLAVVGGGPAGMETARMAAERGHQVTLFEGSDALGGQFLYASSLPNRSGLREFLDYLMGEIRLSPIRVELGAQIASAADLGGGFDTVAVATGAEPVELDPELRDAGVVSWFDILSQGAPPATGSNRAVVCDDGTGFWWTFGVVEMLIAAGWRVLIAAPGTTLAPGIPHESIGALLARLGRAGTEFRILTVLDQAGQGEAHLMNAASGEIETTPCDLVVVQTGRRALSGTGRTLRQAGLDVRLIGDCLAPRRMSHAVYEGQRLARAL